MATPANFIVCALVLARITATITDHAVDDGLEPSSGQVLRQLDLLEQILDRLPLRDVCKAVFSAESAEYVRRRRVLDPALPDGAVATMVMSLQPTHAAQLQDQLDWVKALYLTRRIIRAGASTDQIHGLLQHLIRVIGLDKIARLAPGVIRSALLKYAVIKDWDTLQSLYPLHCDDVQRLPKIKAVSPTPSGTRALLRRLPAAAVKDLDLLLQLIRLGYVFDIIEYLRKLGRGGVLDAARIVPLLDNRHAFQAVLWLVREQDLAALHDLPHIADFVQHLEADHDPELGFYLFEHLIVHQPRADLFHAVTALPFITACFSMHELPGRSSRKNLLHRAAQYDRDQIAGILLQTHSELAHQPDEFGCIPLYYAPITSRTYKIIEKHTIWKSPPIELESDLMMDFFMDVGRFGSIGPESDTNWLDRMLYTPAI